MGHAAQPGAQFLRIALAPFRERNIRAAGMLTAEPPGGLAMPDEMHLRKSPAHGCDGRSSIAVITNHSSNPPAAVPSQRTGTHASAARANPAQFEVWRQDSKPFQDTASIASLTPPEITHIISDAALPVVVAAGMTDEARLCIVYEEAHSLVPEWCSAVGEGDRAAANGTARAILQGRKYGLGCLLITQRTANVTKTILNQCNSVFAMRTFDDTGKDFLANYLGHDYAQVLPNMSERHAVFFGRASQCENPVLMRANDRDAFLAAFRHKD